mmetsp:Transcript_14039/g.22318  ORF Transcript_14039/g.22318 Transcript_14039/m.22318 type:complete len:482 (+) Transcript_14039:482-1927(+)
MLHRSRIDPAMGGTMGDVHQSSLLNAELTRLIWFPVVGGDVQKHLWRVPAVCRGIRPGLLGQCRGWRPTWHARHWRHALHWCHARHARHWCHARHARHWSRLGRKGTREGHLPVRWLRERLPRLAIRQRRRLSGHDRWLAILKLRRRLAILGSHRLLWQWWWQRLLLLMLLHHGMMMLRSCCCGCRGIMRVVGVRRRRLPVSAELVWHWSWWRTLVVHRRLRCEGGSLRVQSVAVHSSRRHASIGHGVHGGHVVLHHRLRWHSSNLLLEYSDLACHEPVLAAFFVVVALNIELHHGPSKKFHALKLAKQGISMHKEITRKLVTVDEPPSPLEGTNDTVQATPDPVGGAQEGAGCDLFGHCASTVVQCHVEFHCLPLSQGRLTILKLLRRQQQVVSVHEKVSIERCGIQEAPAVCKTAHVAPMTLTQAFVGFPIHDGLQGHSVWAATLVGLHVKLDTLALTECVVLALQHDALSLETQLALE